MSKSSYLSLKRQWANSGGFKFLAIFLFAVVCAGCARQGRVSIDIVGNKRLPASLAEKLAAAEKVNTLKAYAYAELNYKGKKKSFDMVIVATKDGKIKLDFVDPLAGTTISISSTPEGLLYTGPSGLYSSEGDGAQDTFKKLTRLPWTPEEAINIFFGGVPGMTSLNGEFPVDSVGRVWIVAGERAVSWQDSEKTMTYQEFKKGKVWVELKHSDYQKKGNTSFPNTLAVDMNGGKVTLKLDFKLVDINVPVDAKIFVPAS